MVRIKEIRKEKGVSITELAEYLNVSRSSMYNYESGASKMDYENLCKTARFLGVSVGEVLGVEESEITANINLAKKETPSYDEEVEKKLKIMNSLLDRMTVEEQKRALRIVNAMLRELM